MWQQAEATEDSSEAGCSIWHVDVDTLPEWILTSVHQVSPVDRREAVLPELRARLGGFNFINHSECPCGRDAAVHLSKSRVDRDHKHCVLIVQPRRRRTSEKEQTAVLTDGCQSRERRTDFNSLHLNCAAQASSEAPPSFSFSPLYCISHRRRRSLEEDASIISSCFCPTVKSAVERPRTREYTPVSYPTSQRFDSEGEVSRRLPTARLWKDTLTSAEGGGRRVFSRDLACPTGCSRVSAAPQREGPL
ncbi:hypothetical protein F7725_015270 [Dissostichus mawsoni]|uniref:Uncharacterized protein n=1 Tax=Dissostichus mawsoni TaxID=36200 RepID=A0A7J5YHY1_DISMA|nr:hypothetical protein F7725_015270 [Dissostichus mawsoni]